MAIIYRTNGAWGSGKGAALAPAEVDNNFWEILQRLGVLETAPTEAPITDITVDGGIMSITVAGGEIFQVNLPVATFTARGNWTHPSHYLFLDIVTEPSLGGYLVLQEHDTETPFDPNRLIAAAPVYQLMFPPGAAGPPGADGADGAAGPAGPTGYFKVDIEAPFASRDAYDGADPGFVFISSNGADGLGGLPVMYIMGPASAGDWTGPFAWGQPAGPTGPEGPAGPPGADGADGTNFDVDATGTFAQRSTYDAEAAGFAYLSTNGDGSGIVPGANASIYIKNSATIADWSARIPFQGPQGPTGAPGATGPAGPAGPTGPAGTNADPDAAGTFAQRSAFDAQTQGFTYLSTNGDGGTNTDASLYIKNTSANADWSARIPFQGPKGNTGPTGPAGVTGPAGPQGPAGTNGVGVPTGGTTGQVLAKTSNANYATGWVDPGGAAPLPTRTLKTVSTATYSAIAGDESKYLRFTNAAGCTVTIDSAVFAAAQELIMRATLGQITLAGTATAGKPADVQAKSRVAMSTIHAYFVDAANYDLTGDLALV